MKKKKPRFFCDHCGCEVASDIKSCPGCGRYFASVRCPSCGQTGPDKMFQNGCPLCGYSTPPADVTKPDKIKTKKIKPPRKNSPEDNLPFWTYVSMAIVLLFLVALLSYFITR
jgi:uncharacterized membrane protein YvbJ